VWESAPVSRILFNDLAAKVTIIPLGWKLLFSSSHLPARSGSTVGARKRLRAYLVLLQVGFT